MSMPRIAFFINLFNYKNTIEGADLDDGNPGIGGTPYLFLLTVKELNSLYGKDYSILLTNTYFKDADSRLQTDFAESEMDAVKYCERNDIKYLVINANAVDRMEQKVFNTSVNIILWAHNTLTAKRQGIAAKEKSIKWVVCVSKSQYQNMADAPCFDKCTYINNIIPEDFYEKAKISDCSEEKVVYIGSLMPQKGAHNLLEIWKYVEEKLPKAQLYIIGGANVWNANADVRSSGGDLYYDRVIKKRLNKLQHPENIHFMGAKGWSSIDPFISTFRLGVVNPSYYMRDETFCLSAIEMAAHGLPIVSRQRHDGLATTIIQDKTGFLEKGNKTIAKRIVSVLSDQELCKELGNAGRIHAGCFIDAVVVGKWCEIIDDCIVPEQKKKSSFISSDDAFLKHDFLLKIAFLIESGKAFDLLLKRIKRKQI